MWSGQEVLNAFNLWALGAQWLSSFLIGLTCAQIPKTQCVIV